MQQLDYHQYSITHILIVFVRQMKFQSLKIVNISSTVMGVQNQTKQIIIEFQFVVQSDRRPTRQDIIVAILDLGPIVGQHQGQNRSKTCQQTQSTRFIAFCSLQMHTVLTNNAKTRKTLSCSQYIGFLPYTFFGFNISCFSYRSLEF